MEAARKIQKSVGDLADHIKILLGTHSSMNGLDIKGDDKPKAKGKARAKGKATSKAAPQPQQPS
eukprot:490877-Pyramimonas_sp.AAC.2